MTEIKPASPEIPVAVMSPASAGETVHNVSRSQILDLLSQNGAVLFRGFAMDTGEFQALSDVLCHDYIRYAWGGRRTVSDSAKIQSVGVSHFSTRLHAELTDTPLQPDVLWFYCERAPSRAGETLICDSAHVANDLDDGTLERYRHAVLRYRMRISADQWKPMFGAADARALDGRIAELECDAYYRRDGDDLIQDYQRPLFTESRFSGQLSCTNAMVTHSVKTRWHYGLRRLAQKARVPPQFRPLVAPFGWVGSRKLSYPTWSDGSAVPGGFLRKISRIAERHSYAHRWQTGDVILLDNTRFLHGRRRLPASIRKIQTRFGYVKTEA